MSADEARKVIAEAMHLIRNASRYEPKEDYDFGSYEASAEAVLRLMELMKSKAI